MLREAEASEANATTCGTTPGGWEARRVARSRPASAPSSASAGPRPPCSRPRSPRPAPRALSRDRDRARAMGPAAEAGASRAGRVEARRRRERGAALLRRRRTPAVPSPSASLPRQAGVALQRYTHPPLPSVATLSVVGRAWDNGERTRTVTPCAGNGTDRRQANGTESSAR